jgi:Helix-turn-helix domain
MDRVTEEDIRGVFCDEARAAELTGLCKQSLYRARREGRLKFSRIGGPARGRVFYTLSDLQQFALNSRNDNG